MNDDRQIESALRRAYGPVDQQGVWDSIEINAAEGLGGTVEGDSAGVNPGSRRSAPRRTHMAVYAIAALIIVAGVAAGTVFGTVLRTNAPWAWLPLEIEGQMIQSVAIDPSDTSVVYAFGDKGIYKTVDGAASWKLVLALETERYNTPIVVVDPGVSSNVYFLATDYGSSDWSQDRRLNSPTLMRSTDGGQTWSDLSALSRDGSSWPVLGELGFVWAMHFDVSVPSTTPYLVTYYHDMSDPPGKMRVDDYWRSDDGGETWVKLDDSASRQIREKLAEGPVTVNQFQWQTIDDSSGKAIGYVIRDVADPDDPSVVYAGTDVGMCKSTDGGKTWARVNEGIRRPVGGPLILDPSSSSVLYAGSDEGVFKSVDGGTNWKLVLPIEYAMFGQRFCSLVMAPSAPSTLYAWTPEGIFRTDDGGETWSDGPIDSMDRGPDGHFDPDNKLLLVASNDPDVVFATNTDGLLRSADGGKTWAPPLDQPTGSGYGTAMWAETNDDSTLYCIVRANPYNGTSSILKSVDKGVTWNSVYVQDRPASFWDYSFLDFVATDYGDPAAIYAAVTEVRFVNSEEVFAGLRAGAEIPEEREVIRHFYRSVDGGSSWEEVEFPGLTGELEELVFDPRSGDTVYALVSSEEHEPWLAAHEYKVFRSTDGGVNWTLFADADALAGSSGPYGTYDGPKLMIDPTSGVLYGAGGKGIFKWVPVVDENAEDEPSGSSDSETGSSASSGGWGCSK